MRFECNDNDNTYNSIKKGCHSFIDVDNDNLYEFSDVNYYGEQLERYYAICPKCGNMININGDMLSTSMKEYAKLKNIKEVNLYKHNRLKSLLIHLDYIEREDGKKIRRR